MSELKGRIASNCSDSSVRTGLTNCDRQPGAITALGLTPINALFPTDEQDFNDALEGYVSDTALRLMPVKGVAGATRNGGDINAPELGTYGGARPIGQNAVNIAYTIDGGMCLYKELSKLNGRTVRVFELDADNYLFGTVVTKANTDYFAGYEGQVYVTFTPTDGSALGYITLTVYYPISHEKELQNTMSLQLPNGLPDGLVGVELEAVGADSVKVFTVCDHTDVTDIYKDEWAASMFVTKGGTDATTATYSDGVIKLAPTGEYRVAGASVLAAGDITGLDGAETYVSITAAG